jgi:hypothetical protein
MSLLLCLPVFACSDDSTGAPTPTTVIVAPGTWTLADLDPRPAGWPFDQTLQLDLRADGTFVAQDRCNSVLGNWSHDGSAVVALTDDVISAMACADRVDVLPFPFGDAHLEGEDQLTIDGTGGRAIYERSP